MRGRCNSGNEPESQIIMQISPGVDSSEWRALKLDDPNSHDWERAISILRSRIYGRYFDPADQLILAEQSKAAYERRFGFAIVAIDCLLIETLGAFIQGLETTDGKSKATFCEFLTTRQRFRGVFTKRLAAQFYKQFRCGILHQAEVGGSSKVWSVGDLVRETDGNLIVNRNELHENLKAEFEDYLVELSDPVNSVLRQDFRKKMDFVCRH
jgi:hypothetical protein